MAFYGKTFDIEKEENLDGFVQSLPLPQERKQKILQFKPKQRIEKNGDAYTLTVITTLGEKVYKFKSGVEFADTFNERNVNIKITVTGNIVTQVIKFDEGTLVTLIKNYTDNTFTEEITHPNWDGVARRLYKAM